MCMCVKILSILKKIKLKLKNKRTNDLTTIYCHLDSPPILHARPFKHFQTPFHKWFIARELKSCEDFLKEDKHLIYARCVIKSFEYCTSELKHHPKGPAYLISLQCIDQCNEQFIVKGNEELIENQLFPYANCLLRCYGWNNKKY